MHPAARTPSAKFIATLQKIASFRDQYEDAVNAGIYRSIARVYFFSTAGRVVWMSFDPRRREFMMWNWLQQALKTDSADSAGNILCGSLLRLEAISGDVLPDAGFDGHWIDEQAQCAHVKHRMFDDVLAQAQNGTWGTVRISNEWYQAIITAMYDEEGAVDDVLEVLCLTQLMFSNARFSVNLDSSWSTFLEDLDEQMMEDGFRSSSRAQPQPHPETQASPLLTAVGIPPTSAPSPSPVVEEPSEEEAIPEAVEMPGAHQSLQEAIQVRRARFSTRTAKLEVDAPTEEQQAEVSDVEGSWKLWRSKLYVALISPPVAGNNKELNADKKFRKKLEVLEQFGETVEDVCLSTAAAMLEATINLHKDGTPLREDERKAFWVKRGGGIREADLSYGIKDRLDKMISGIRQNKLVAADCTSNDRSVEYFAWGPDMSMARKGLWAELNSNKASKIQGWKVAATSNSVDADSNGGEAGEGGEDEE